MDWDDDDETLIWPETIDDKMMPRIDGVLVLYDIKDASSLENVPEMLSKCFLQQDTVRLQLCPIACADLQCAQRR